MYKLLIVVISQIQSDLATLIQIMSVVFSEKSPVHMISKRRGKSTITDHQIRLQLSGVSDGSVTSVGLMFTNFLFVV